MPICPMPMQYPRPSRLSDPHNDFTDERLCLILATPDDRLQWNDFRDLLGPFLPAGTYDEVVYFLPLAFNFMAEHDEDVLDLVTSVVWFASEYSDRLREDGLISVTRRNLSACLDHWTASFDVVHFDREGCRSKGWNIEYSDYVRHSEVVCETTCDLVRFIAHQDLAELFAWSLAHHGGDAVKAAWFIEYTRARTDVYQPPEHPPIQELLQDRDLLLAAADVVRKEMVNVERSPTYWNDTFSTLGL